MEKQKFMTDRILVPTISNTSFSSSEVMWSDSHVVDFRCQPIPNEIAQSKETLVRTKKKTGLQEDQDVLERRVRFAFYIN